MIGDFAAAVADESRATVRRVPHDRGRGPTQKQMQNSVLQLANARRKLGIDGAVGPAGTGAAVDDIVDSGWTLTVAGALLRSHGSGAGAAVRPGRRDQPGRMMFAEGLSLNARALILACSSLGMPRGATTKPFGPRGWARIAERLAADGGEPGTLLTMAPPELERLFDGSASDDAERLGQLLGTVGPARVRARDGSRRSASGSGRWPTGLPGAAPRQIGPGCAAGPVRRR